MPSIRRTTDENEPEWSAIPFPIQQRLSSPESSRNPHRHAHYPAESSESTDDVLAAFATMSRRINDLARELKCLGFFDDEGDHPRAA